jgi:uncharacterized protein
VIRDTATGVEIDVRVAPRAGKSEIDGQRNGMLLVRIAAPPVENAANEALIELLARTLSVPRRSVQLVRGKHSRSKIILVAGVSADFVRDRLQSG